jgi:iron complex outermembrane recepter protein
MSGSIKAKVAIAVATAIATSAWFAAAPPASAQEAADAKPAEEVVVTGSRIRRDPVEQTAPLQVQGAVDIERTGEVTVGEFLQRLPIAGSAINRSNNASGNLGFPPDGGGIGAGASEVDLRYLGSRRVLVLVDGKRWIRGSSASGVSGAVDLNTIPVDAIDRIEVLQDGASPIYGSDAIAGVVNVITKRQFEGFSARAYQGAYTEGDGYTQEYNFSWGGSTEGSRAFLAAGYARQEAVFSKDRSISETIVPGAPPVTNGSSGTPQGRIVIADPRGDFNGNGKADDTVSITLNDGAVNDIGNLANFNPANPASGDYHAFGTADRFNFRPFNFLTTPNRRVNVFGKAERDLTDDIMFAVTAAYTNRRSTNQAAPNPLFLGSDAGSGFYLDNILIPANQPYNPFGFALDGTDNLVLLARRPLEAGPRIFNQNVDTFLVSTTVNGEQDLVGKTFFWDVNFNWGRNNASQRGQNIFNSRKLALALGDPAVCNATPGCVPFNIFGGMGPNGTGTITQDMLDWATFVQSDQSEQELSDITANISGDLFSLPAGEFGYAFGFEHRKESGSFQPDAAVSAGETADVPANPTEGQVQVNELYLELNAPILAEMPFVKRLELSAAVRSSDYDNFGRDEVYKGGLYWRMTTDFSVRFNYAQGFRAPNIGELFNTGSRFDSALNDPCSNFTTKSAAIQQACQALGVPASFVQVNPQISVQTGGNPLLTPEKSDTWTAGFGYSPNWASDISWMENLTFDFNYYDIELKGAIQALNAQNQLDSCVATLDPLFCSGITRGGGGSITAFANQLTNIGRVETDGFDVTATLALKPTPFGTFRLNWASTYLNSYKEFTPGPAGLIETERAGTEIGSPTKGLVRFKSALITDWELGAWNSSVTLRYISSLTETCPGVLFDFEVQDLCTDPDNAINRMGSAVYADAQVGWRPPVFDERLDVSLGVNNLLDKDPPLCFSCDLNNYDGTIYPVPGRFIYARIGLKFD